MQRYFSYIVAIILLAEETGVYPDPAADAEASQTRPRCS